MNTFSERHGYSVPEPDITIREDAPSALRGAIPTAATNAGMGFSDLRQVVCQALTVAPDIRGNWSESNVMAEVAQLLEECEWPEVYDVVEAIAHRLLHQSPSRYDHQMPQEMFSRDINRVLHRNGIGWQLIGDRIEMRGSEVFEIVVREGRDELWKAGKQTTSTELHEALRDLSRRPTPELTGAIQHGIAALECLSKDLTGSKDTLGALVKNNPSLFPSPLGDAISKVYGFASENGRHLREGGEPSFEEAELVVGLSGVLCRYLGRKIPKP
jgi:hypothetical protein